MRFSLLSMVKKLSLHDLSGVEAHVTGLVDTGTCLSIARLAWQMVVDLDAIDAHAIHKTRHLVLHGTFRPAGSFLG